MMGATRFGSTSRNMMRVWLAPSDRLAERERVTAHDPGYVGPREERDHEDDEREARLHEPPEASLRGGGADRDDADRKEQGRHREDDVGSTRDDRVDGAAEVPGEQPQNDADEHCDPGRPERDDEGGPGAVDDAHENIAAGRIRAHQKFVRGTLGESEFIRGERAEELVLAVPDDARNEGCEDRDQDQQDDHHEADDRGLVLLEASPEELPRRTPDDSLHRLDRLELNGFRL